MSHTLAVLCGMKLIKIWQSKPEKKEFCPCADDRSESILPFPCFSPHFYYVFLHVSETITSNQVIQYHFSADCEHYNTQILRYT